MAIVHNKNPIEKSFQHWIDNYPESFHPLDMKRFYIFVKCICRYSRKDKNSVWLKKKIKKSGKNLSEKTINVYCQKFVELQKFYNAPCLQIYNSI